MGNRASVVTRSQGKLLPSEVRSRWRFGVGAGVAGSVGEAERLAYSRQQISVWRRQTARGEKERSEVPPK